MKPLVCGSCKACCQGPRELALKKEDWGKYEEYEKDGWMYLARKENQDCVYLGEEGCTIHGNHPQTCQDFDCRDFITHPDLPERVRKAAYERL